MLRGIGTAALVLGCAACTTPAPRIPTQESGNLHISLITSERSSNDRYHGSYTVYGIESASITPGTGGWGWEGSFRFGSADGKDAQHITNPPNPPPLPGNTSKTVVVDNERDTDVYELSIGTRQTFFPDSALSPYFGVGGSIFKTHNSDHYTGIDADSDDPATPAFDPLPIDQHKHFQTVALGLYMHTGLAWSLLHDQIGDSKEFVLGFDVRGLLGDEFSYLELSVSLGFGK